MEMTPQHFHTILTSCAILPTMPTTNSLHALTCSLFKHTKWTGHSDCSLHSLPLIHICHFQQQYNFTTYLTLQHIPYRPSTAHALQFSACSQDRSYLPCWVCTLHIATTHNITHSICINCTPHWVNTTTLPLPSTILCTQLTNISILV